MSTITREQLRARAREKVKSLEFAVTQTAFADSRAELEEELELARIALASLEAEAVCVIDQSNLDYLKSGFDADVWPASRTEMGDVLLYRSAPPAPVSVPDEITAEDCPAFVKYDVTDVDEAWASGFNACRAAMLQGADSNSQWVACSERMPDDMEDVLVTDGEDVKSMWWNGNKWDSWAVKYSIDSDDVTHWMLMPAAPQQEVKSGD